MNLKKKPYSQTLYSIWFYLIILRFLSLCIFFSFLFIFCLLSIRSVPYKRTWNEIYKIVSIECCIVGKINFFIYIVMYIKNISSLLTQNEMNTHFVQCSVNTPLDGYMETKYSFIYLLLLVYAWPYTTRLPCMGIDCTRK